jgi:NarL family two-component system response regulator LiaR
MELATQNPIGDVTATGKTRTILVDDQLVFRLGLRFFLSDAMPELSIVGEATSAGEGLSLAQQLEPDLALLDGSLPDMAADAVVGRFRRAHPDCRVVVLANVLDPVVLGECVAAGAHACLLKTLAPQRLVDALREVISGATWMQPEVEQLLPPFASSGEGNGSAGSQRPLTARELEVLKLIAAGLSNAQIAYQLHISEQTVKTHIGHLMRKIGVRSRLQAARYAMRNGLVEI